MHNAWAHLLWVYYPYLMLASFFFGTFIRFKYFHAV
ncbi:respiratory nitrate reductase subunit gamma [Limosilactobacillus fermentum]|nr:respiratory nitrate reductase subunit gamma [Limosilactobacillus fermentum]